MLLYEPARTLIVRKRFVIPLNRKLNLLKTPKQNSSHDVPAKDMIQQIRQEPTNTQRQTLSDDNYGDRVRFECFDYSVFGVQCDHDADNYYTRE